MNRFVFIIPVNTNHDSDDKNRLKTSVKELCLGESKCHQKLYEDILKFNTLNENLVKVGLVPNDAQTSEWMSLDDLMKVYDVTLEKFWSKDVKEEKYTWLLADAIHNFADQLPVMGNCFVDVIVHMTKYVLNLEDNIELFGALARLHFWHNAVIRINCSDSDKEQLSDWKDMLYVCDDNIESGAEFWRGYISLGKQTSDGPYLPYFRMIAPHENCKCETTSKTIDKSHTVAKKPNSTRRSSIYQDLVNIVGHDLLLIGEYHKATIPSYILSPRRFYLQLLCTAETTKNSQDFVKYMSSDYELCYLFRLGYNTACISERFTKEEWTNSDATYCVPRLEKYLKGSTCLHFLVHYQDFHLVAQLLCIPQSFDPAFFLSSYSSIQSTDPSITDHDITKFLRSLPHIPKDLLLDINDLVLETQHEALNIFENTYKKLDTDEKSQHCAIVALMKMVKDATIKKLIENGLISASTHVDSSVQPSTHSDLEFEKDQNDWPERIALLEESINTSKVKRHSSLDTLGGMEPPALDFCTISLDAKALLKNFKQSGEPKKEVMVNSSKLTPTAHRHDGKCPKHAPNSDMKTQTWPEALQDLCHGTHFNVDENSERNQIKCDKLKSQYLIDETGSTCSNMENKLSKCIKVPKNPVVSSKISHQAVRRSPRKHLSQKGYQPMHSSSNRRSSISQRRSGTLNVQKKNAIDLKTRQSALSDTHRMKLRCCIVDELEKYGITLHHPAFKDCGKKLFAICRPFIKDLLGAKSITSEMRKICQSHVKQVIDFELEKIKRYPESQAFK